MTYTVDYYDEIEKCQKTREATQDEIQEIEERKASMQSAFLFNIPIFEKLEEIDRKSIRALREGDSARIEAYEAEAAQLRLQLRK